MKINMTDNEIIKAWEQCQAFEDDCSRCPLMFEGCHQLILDLISRQQADLENYKQIAEHQQSVSMDKEVEIRRLRAEVERLLKEVDELEETSLELAEDNLDYATEICELYKCKFTAEDVADNIIRAKTEAVKEFAEKVKKEFYTEYTWLEIEREYFEERIDNLSKEMVGEDK